MMRVDLMTGQKTVLADRISARLGQAGIALSIALCAAPVTSLAAAAAQEAASAPRYGDGHADPVDVATTSKGSVQINGRTIAYTATAGALVVRRDDGTPYHRLSYNAFIADGKKDAHRPITFIWDGGPGGPAVWAQITAWGPKRLDMSGAGPKGAGPFTFVNNEFSLLDQTDLVFIDAPLTGYSTAVGDGKFAEIDGMDNDALAFKRFITRYLSVAERWNSPKFIMGESYGGFRDVLVANLLQQEAVELSGIVFISTFFDTNRLAINFPSAAKGPDGWYVDTLPSFATSARALGKAGTGESVEGWAEKARRFAAGPYAMALRQGDLLPESERVAIADQMAALIGVKADVVRRYDLRLSTYNFRSEILREEGQVVGRFDALARAADIDASGSSPNFDPAWSQRNGVYRSAYTDYLSRELGVKSPEPFTFFAPGIPGPSFDWTTSPALSGSGNLPNMRSSLLTNTLGSVARQNPKLRFFFASGYYDLATPFYALEQDVAHLGLGQHYGEMVRFRHYEGGHMFYEDKEMLRQFRGDLRAYYADTLNTTP